MECDTIYYDLELFGKIICNIRNTMGYTQKEVSKLTKITTETMRKIENGKVIPNQITLELLSPALKEDLNQLLLNCRISNYKEYYEIKNSLENKLETGNYKDLENILERLNTILGISNLNNYVYKSIKQLILFVESIILKIINKDYNSSLKRLIDAMEVTTPLFKLDNYDAFVYSSIEIRILMNIALLINKLKSTDKCLEILLFCLKSLSPEEIDFTLRVYYNLAYTYHRKDLHEEALYYAKEGIKTCIKNNTLSCLALLYSRKCIAEYFLKDDNFMTSFQSAINLYDITIKDSSDELSSFLSLFHSN